MFKLMQQLASVRLWVGISVLTMGLSMASCQQPAVVEPKMPLPDVKTAVATDSTNEDDPPEKPVKPGGN